jgi:hypothetical protein
MGTNPVPPQPQIPEEVWGIFCGGIEQATAQKVVNNLTIALETECSSPVPARQSMHVNYHTLKTLCRSKFKLTHYPSVPQLRALAPFCGTIICWLTA